MAHFSELDENNVVVRVIAVSNDVLNGLEFPESESIGVAFCKELYGADTVWLQTSINKTFRKRYGQIGYTYVPEHDIFLDPKPYESWVLSADTLGWVSPIPKPEEGRFTWDEPTVSWVKLDLPDDFVEPKYEVT